MSRSGAPARRGRLLGLALVGLGLVAAPFAFQMFERAPKGGDMIEAFEPYMTSEEIGQFRGHLDQIDAARHEATTSGLLGDRPLPAVAELDAQWGGLRGDMDEMLDSMEDNLSEYRGVAALPPFPLFPWFFVIPGVLVAAVAVLAVPGWLSVRWARPVLVALGVGLLLAPAVFQMFTRAPGGSRMIADFEPMMTDQRVEQVQGYFLTIGAAEGELRHLVLPGSPRGSKPAIEAFVTDWPSMSADMAPMIGTMADNVDNFAAVVALPPFVLFPWFFVIPGALVAGVAATVGRSAPEPEPAVLTDLRGAQT